MSPSHSLSLRASLHPSPASDVERLRPADNRRPARRIKASGAREAGGEDERGMRGEECWTREDTGRELLEMRAKKRGSKRERDETGQISDGDFPL